MDCPLDLRRLRTVRWTDRCIEGAYVDIKYLSLPRQCGRIFGRNRFVRSGTDFYRIQFIAVAAIRSEPSASGVIPSLDTTAHIHTSRVGVAAR